MNFEFSNMPVLVDKINDRMIIQPRLEAGSEETLYAVLSEREMLVLALCTMTRWCGIAHIGEFKFGCGSASVQDALEKLFRERSKLLRTTEAGILVFGKDENAAVEAGVEWLGVRKIPVETRFVGSVFERSKVQVKINPSSKEVHIFGREVVHPQKCTLRAKY